ncbi:hypothetical protein PF005_g11919 [Phytophthora fragariae]|uniref:Uncharacterized protein n=1 Tax=Phytophthora fragariae TaxID=53985 RepID=A0A6A3KL13_9STRA|nr:hypothetical protein PF003_g24488 [Phytophthora fragariae]KAE8936865.1 hypothetical protein PF009_g13215 [Phytophthora fragariae]KAE9007980.1 hypothetical protein PF011_g10887 [Phytophthora fragariae]KAE9109318.1 hypothetical protein PF007_g12289 [Phytophthora fragariae]KAE9143966.1 hypothetical protein PF006_g11050 [Phytophthora fragariae]
MERQSAHKKLVLGLTEESKSILLELGSILSPRYHNRGPMRISNGIGIANLISRSE